MSDRKIESFDHSEATASQSPVVAEYGWSTASVWNWLLVRRLAWLMDTGQLPVTRERAQFVTTRWPSWEPLGRGDSE